MPMQLHFSNMWPWCLIYIHSVSSYTLGLRCVVCWRWPPTPNRIKICFVVLFCFFNISASIKVKVVLVVFFLNGAGSMAPTDLWFCNANGSVWRPWVHSNLYEMKRKHVLTICSCTQSATTQHLCLRCDLICENHRERERERMGERVHSLVISLGDVMGSQPVFVKYSLLSTHSCVTL